jgi:arsenic resistance protein ArsH
VRIGDRRLSFSAQAARADVPWGDLGVDYPELKGKLNGQAVRPTQGKTLAVMQLSGGSQSFNAVNQMRVLDRWMRMITLPNPSSVAEGFMAFDKADRMKPSAYYEHVVDVMEEPMKFTLFARDVSPYLVDRYSERRESAVESSKRVNQRSI